MSALRFGVESINIIDAQTGMGADPDKLAGPMGLKNWEAKQEVSLAKPCVSISGPGGPA